ncbi:MAG: ParB/RepB/Spo0J family partition protein [Clostridiales bacterium]|nr:ParB/RepB/Spo0J family partition protein [Clostridiales bacterium]
MTVKRGLGKGLGALIATEESLAKVNDGVIVEIDLNQIEPNKNQPRKYFSEESLNELAESIREFGIIQPLILNKENGFYTIVAGERRWRAARLAKLKSVPAILRSFDEMETLQIALIENIQREDLNPIEEALCYQRLSDIFFFRQEDIAKRVGKSRNTISYLLGLLKLDPRVQNFIIEGRLTAGHGRKLLDAPSDVQFETAERVIEEDLSVTQAQALVEKINHDRVNGKKEVKKALPDSRFGKLEEDLMQALGTKVYIKDGKKKGKIEIEYYTSEDLDRITAALRNTKLN